MRASVMAVGTILLLSGLACGDSNSTTEQMQALAPPAGGPASAEPSALALADSVVAGLGGWEAWNGARFFDFTFAIAVQGETRRSTRHRWDRFTGDYRIDGTTRDGKAFTTIWNLQSGTGRAWLDGLELAGQEAHEQLERANAICVNDCYWFLMPFKLHDPGVHLEDAGVRVDSLGKEWRVLALHFGESVGLTPGDRYWVYVDPATGRVGRWDYILEGYEPGASPSVFSWEEWREVGPIQLAMSKHSADGLLAIRFENVQVTGTPPAEAFVFESDSG